MQKLADRFSQALMERWQMGQGVNDWICIRIQNFHHFGPLPYSADEWRMFNDFNLHVQMPGITCFKMQAVSYTDQRPWWSFVPGFPPFY